MPDCRDTGQLQADIIELQSPVAVVCELPRPIALTKVRAVIEQAHELWPGIPLVGCQLVSHRPGWKTRKQLIKLGFRAVAESAAQLPALLREVEENPDADDLPETFKSLPNLADLALPKSLRSQSLRDAFSLIAALHFATSHQEAAAIAVDGLARITSADRWSIFAADQNTSRDETELELLATQTSSVFENLRKLTAQSFRQSRSRDTSDYGRAGGSLSS